MFKNIVKLEHVVADKVIHLLCDNDTPLASVKEALFQFGAYVAQIEANAKAQQEAVKAEADKASQDSVPPIVEEVKAA